MKRILDFRAYTLIEIIVSLGILGIVIIPLMNVFVLCHKLLNINHREYETIQTAQLYMEEIKAMDKIDEGKYSYIDEEGLYERVVVEDSINYGAEIRIIPIDNSGLYRIEIYVLHKGEVVNDLFGSVIIE